MHRRRFLHGVSAVGLTAAVIRPSSVLASLAPSHGLGLQLWTVRNQMNEDKEATLKSVAAAGYDQVELMNVLDSGDIAQIAKDEGLDVSSAFFNWQTIAEPEVDGVPSLEKIISAAEDMGLEHLVFGYIGKSARDTSDKLKKIADTANSAAEKIKAAGMVMSYHNHAFEFEKLDGDQSGFEIFMERFDKDLVKFELDLFWAAIGGWDPADTLEKLGKRVAQVHLKDLKDGVGTIYDEGKVPNEAFQEVGDGILDMKKCVEIAVANGVTQFHVEQDQSPDPLQSIRQSADYVTKNLSISAS